MSRQCRVNGGSEDVGRRYEWRKGTTSVKEGNCDDEEGKAGEANCWFVVDVTHWPCRLSAHVSIARFLVIICANLLFVSLFILPNCSLIFYVSGNCPMGGAYIGPSHPPSSPFHPPFHFHLHAPLQNTATSWYPRFLHRHLLFNSEALSAPMEYKPHVISVLSTTTPSHGARC